MGIKYPSIIYRIRLFGFILPIGVMMHLYLAVFQAGANLIYQVILGFELNISRCGILFATSIDEI
jgi:hypothetical protein